MIANLGPSLPHSTSAMGFILRQDLLGPDRRNDHSRVRLLRRIRSEFAEMPCLRLTEPQSARLFALRQDICRRVLTTLIAEGFLWRGQDARYGLRCHH
jgi:hypothetical protein